MSAEITRLYHDGPPQTPTVKHLAKPKSSKKQEEEEALKEADRMREEVRRTQAARQIEQQRMYKNEMKNSYKSILDGQMSQ